MTQTHSALTIQEAQPHQAQALSELALRSKAHWGYSKEFMALCRQELLVTKESLVAKSVHYCVAQNGEQLLGFYALERVSAERFELDAMFVDPDHLGQGVGRALLLHAKELLKILGGSEMLIQSDPNAADFYLSMGGELLGLSDSLSIPGRQLPLLKIAV